jgi:hypothetical protein
MQEGRTRHGPFCQSRGESKVPNIMGRMGQPDGGAAVRDKAMVNIHDFRGYELLSPGCRRKCSRENEGTGRARAEQGHMAIRCLRQVGVSITKRNDYSLL